MFKSFLINAAAFLVWSFGLATVALAPIFFDGPEAAAAIVCATVAAFGIMTIIFWESL